MEDISVRAITIGVSVFLVIITLSVTFLYLSTARSVATEINQNRQNIAISYDKILEFDVAKDTITGNDFINFIRDNMNNKNIRINIVKINEENVTYENINLTWKNNLGNLSEKQISIIKPSYTVSLVKEIKKSVTIVNAELKEATNIRKE